MFEDAELRAILESALLAPSADNCHPLRFMAVNGVLRAHHTGTELPPLGGYKRALLLLSLGALAENLTIAASRFGLKANTTFFPPHAPDDCLLQVSFVQADTQGDPLDAAIPLRHTNRRVFFRGPPLDERERGELDAAVTGFPGCEFSWLDTPALRSRAISIMRLAEEERFRCRVLHQELFATIRFDVGWHRTCDEGLPPGALGVERPLRPFFAMMRYWPVMRAFNLLGAHRLLGWRASGLPARLAPNLGMIAVKNPDDLSICVAGRAFQRLWLTVTKQGRVLQPLPASVLFAFNGAVQEGIPINLQKRLRQGWQELFPRINPIMLFRIGLAADLAVATGRKPLTAYIVESVSSPRQA